MKKKWFSEIFPIVIPIVIQKRSATPKNSSYKLFLGILVHIIAIHHCAKEQLAWLDVVQIRAPYYTVLFVYISSDSFTSGTFPLIHCIPPAHYMSVQCFSTGFARNKSRTGKYVGPRQK